MINNLGRVSKNLYVISQIMFSVTFFASCADVSSKSNVKSTVDAKLITENPDGTFQVECYNGTSEKRTREQIFNDEVCRWVPEVKDEPKVGSYVDFHSGAKLCAAAWTWDEFLPSVWATEANNCEMESVSVLDEEGTMVPVTSQEEDKIKIASCPNFDNEQKCIEDVKARGMHRDLKTYPDVTNIPYLDSNSRFYPIVNTAVSYPTEAIREIYTVDVGQGECAVYTVGIGIGTGATPPPSGCVRYSRNYDVYVNVLKLKYTLPTKTRTIKKDSWCPDTVEVLKTPSKSSKGRSAPYLTWDEVSAPDFPSIGEASIAGASRSVPRCPHGIMASSPADQAAQSFTWIGEKQGQLDVGDSDTQAVISYLKALALEKRSELQKAQLRAILKLHKAYPAFAFSGEETDEGASQTSAEAKAENRKMWAAIERELELSSGATVLTFDELLATTLSLGGFTINADQPGYAIHIGISSDGLKLNISPYGGEFYQLMLDGSLARVNRGGEQIFNPGAAEFEELKKTIVERVSPYMNARDIQDRPEAKLLVSQILSYLGAPISSTQNLSKSWEDLRAAIGEEKVTVPLDHRSISLKLGASAPDLEVRHSLYKAPDTDFSFTAAGIKKVRAGWEGSYSAHSPEFYEEVIKEIDFVKDAIAEGARLNAPNTDILDLYRRYLDIRRQAK